MKLRRKVRLREYNITRQPTMTDYHNALRWIRHISLIHYMGGAFEPEHMRDIADLAGQALNGKKIERFPHLKELEQAVEEKARLWMEEDDAESVSGDSELH
jgi:hypothetical protein